MLLSMPTLTVNTVQEIVIKQQI